MDPSKAVLAGEALAKSFGLRRESVAYIDIGGCSADPSALNQLANSSLSNSLVGVSCLLFVTRSKPYWL